jgi:hypothetical protein
MEMRTNGLFERDELLAALDELAARLAHMDIETTIYVVGGAALALEYYDRPATRDVDASISFKTAEVLAVSSAMAAENGWPTDWLNTQAATFIPHYGRSKPAWRVIIERDKIRIAVPSTDVLLAMKLNAARGRRDAGDISQLLGLCGIHSIAEAEELFEGFYPNEALTFVAIATVRDWLDRQSNPIDG